MMELSQPIACGTFSNNFRLVEALVLARSWRSITAGIWWAPLRPAFSVCAGTCPPHSGEFEILTSPCRQFHRSNKQSWFFATLVAFTLTQPISPACFWLMLCHGKRPTLAHFKPCAQTLTLWSDTLKAVTYAIWLSTRQGLNGSIPNLHVRKTSRAVWGDSDWSRVCLLRFRGMLEGL